MKDLYGSLQLSPRATRTQIAARLDQLPPSPRVRDARYVLLDHERRAEHDRCWTVLSVLGQLQADLGVGLDGSWPDHHQEEFTRPASGRGSALERLLASAQGKRPTASGPSRRSPRQEKGPSSGAPAWLGFLGLLAVGATLAALVWPTFKQSSDSPRPTARGAALLGGSPPPNRLSPAKRTSQANDRWRGNRLENGASPFSSYFGTVYGEQYLGEVLILNQTGQDAVVLLVRVGEREPIRNEYVRARSQFRITGVPDGAYYLKTMMGRDWNPERRLGSGDVRGGFETEASFQAMDDPSDWLRMETRVDPSSGRVGYQTYSMTLHQVVNGNVESRYIADGDFLGE